MFFQNELPEYLPRFLFYTGMMHYVVDVVKSTFKNFSFQNLNEQSLSNEFLTESFFLVRKNFVNGLMYIKYQTFKYSSFQNSNDFLLRPPNNLCLRHDERPDVGVGLEPEDRGPKKVEPGHCLRRSRRLQDSHQSHKEKTRLLIIAQSKEK